MADKDHGDGPSLEMPSLGSLFKRRKKPAETDDAPTVTREELDAVVRGRKPAAPEPDADAAAQDAPETMEETEGDAGDEAAEAAPGAVPDGAPAEGATADDEPTVVVPAAEARDDEPTAVIAPVAEPATEETSGEDPAGEDEATGESTGDERPLFADEAPASADEDEDEAEADEDDAPESDPDGADADEEDADEPAARTSRSFTLPLLPGRVAAAVTGLVVGILAVALTYLAVQGCEQVKGTSTCGTPGFFLLIAIMILLVVLGSSLLNAWQVADPGSTSFMAVGLLAVVALLFLIRVIYSPWMALVIPLVAVVTFVVSHWLTSLFVEDDEPAS